MCLGKVLQAPEELECQNLRCWQTQTADKVAPRLWIALSKPSDLSETWSFNYKKKSNVYLRVLQDMLEYTNPTKIIGVFKQDQIQILV